MANSVKFTPEKENPASCAEFWTVTGTITTPTTGVRGTENVRMNSQARMLISLDNDDEQHIGFRFTAETLPPATDTICSIFNEFGTSVLELRYTATGKLVIRQIETSADVWASDTTLTPGIPYYIEWSTLSHTSTGTSAVYLNGALTPDAAVWTGDTSRGGSTILGQFAFGLGTGTATWVFRWEDFYVNNTIGAITEDNTRWRDTKLTGYLPISDTLQIDLTPLGAGDNFEEVNDATGNDGDTSEVHGTTGYDLYAFFGSLGYTPLRIHGASLDITGKKTDAGVRDVAANCFSDATLSGGVTAAKALGLSYATKQFHFPQNPDTSDTWDVAGLTAAYFGPEVG